MKATMKIIAAAAMVAFATPAIAGGVTVAEEGDSKLKLEGVFYSSITQDKTVQNGTTTAKATGLSVDRAYFTAKYYFDKNWYARITTDVQYESANAANTARDNNIFLKAAYLEGKLVGDALAIRIGQSHTPWIDYEQGLWKHRYAAKVASDYFGFDSSFDLGVGLKGKLADGMLGYFFTATNGKGYGSGNAKFNAVDLDARIGLYPVKGLTFDVQYRTGYKGTKTWNAATQANTLGTKSNFAQAMITYGTDDFRIGANYYSNKATNKTTNNATKVTGPGVWAWVKFGEGFGAFARYDNLKTKIDGNTVKMTTTHYVAGLEYSPIKNVTFALVMDQDKDKNFGNVTAATKKVTKAGLFSEFKF